MEAPMLDGANVGSSERVAGFVDLDVGGGSAVNGMASSKELARPI
jgi:hypothetical protein